MEPSFRRAQMGEDAERNSLEALSFMVQETPSQKPHPDPSSKSETVSNARLRSPFLMGGVVGCGLLVLAYVLF